LRYRYSKYHSATVCKKDSLKTCNKNIFDCRKEPPAGRVVALLVEEFETLMAGRPGFVEDSGSDVGARN
jgi:hypothetical protein